MKKQLFLTGSVRFFWQFKDFKPHDLDFILIVDKNDRDNIMLYYSGYSSKILSHLCVFSWEKHKKTEYIKYLLSDNKEHPSSCCTFLIPEFAQFFNIQISDLFKIKPLIYNLIDKHKYYIIIYESYIKNNSFTLTNKQLEKAYSIYKKYYVNK